MHPSAPAPLTARGQDGAGGVSACRRRGLGGVHVGLLLGLCDVLLVPDPLVTEPVVNLNKPVYIHI